jgi:hypothetical protein
MARRDWKRALVDWVDALADALVDAVGGREPALVPVPVKASDRGPRPGRAGDGRRDR